MANPKMIVFTPWQAANHVNMSNANRTAVNRGNTLTYQATDTRA